MNGRVKFFELAIDMLVTALLPILALILHRDSMPMHMGSKTLGQMHFVCRNYHSSGSYLVPNQLWLKLFSLSYKFHFGGDFSRRGRAATGLSLIISISNQQPRKRLPESLAINPFILAFCQKLNRRQTSKRG